MNFLPAKKSFYFFLIFVVSTQTTFAQAKLSVNGARFNLAPTVYVSTNDVLVSGTSTVSVSGATLKVADSIVSAGAIDVSNGTVEMNGTQAQKIPANSFTNNVIKNLRINNSNSTVAIAGPLALTDVLTLSNGSLASDGYLTLKSTVLNTARVAPVTTTALPAVDGNVVVERYIPGKRAFRFLTAPVNTAGSIKANWMENTNNPTNLVNNNPNPGFGTHITGYAGNAGGFDVTLTNNPSIFTYDNLAQLWNNVTSTGGTLSPGAAYRVLVRGSRSTDLNTNTPPTSNTTIRSTGTLVTGTFTMAKSGGGGTVGMPVLSSANNGYSFIGNPYASPIDWNLLERTDITSSIYVFDPTITGSNGRGAYVSYNGLLGINSNDSSQIDNNIQSGQSFFVQTNGPNPVLTIKEIHKATGFRSVFRRSNLPHISMLLLLPGQDTAGSCADGLSAYFSNDFDSTLGDEDSYKLTNQDENISILRDGKNLSIEGRKPVTSADTLPLQMWQLTQKKYSFKVTLDRLGNDVSTYFQDGFLHTNTLLSNDASNLVPFVITSDSASLAKDRFKIVFKNSRTLAVSLDGIKAFAKDKGIEVEWNAQSEINMEKYEVEKSANAQQFVKTATIKAKNNSLVSGYNWFDENPFVGENFYRIKSVAASGEVKYSSIAKVVIKNGNEMVSVFATDKSNIININLKNIAKGNYNISLLNNLGQKMYSGSINHAGGSATKIVKLNSYLPAGIYHLQLADKNKVFNVAIFID